MRQYATVGTSELATEIDSIDTALTVVTGHGVRFDPSPAGVALSASDPLVLTLLATPDDPNFEVVYVTAPRSTDTFPTIVRAREGTTARDWPIGTLVQAGLTGVGMDELSAASWSGTMIQQSGYLLRPAGYNSTLWQLNSGITAEGTIAGRPLAVTNFLTRQSRVAYFSAGTAGLSVSVRSGVIAYAGTGTANGFRYVSRWAATDDNPVADARLFAGLVGQTTALGNVNPTTLLNCVGLGADNGQTTLRIIHNDGSGTATTVDLGANFPANTRSADWYELELDQRSTSANIRWWVRRFTTAETPAFVASGVITTDLPAANTGLAQHLWRNNGATAVGVILDIGGVAVVPR